MEKEKAKNLKAEKYTFLSGGGEMGLLIREKDWSKTVLGDPDDWPQSLRTIVSVMLDNPFGMYIAWGNDYIQLYNDGYRPILGATKHPQALGISTRETFAEIWHIIGSMFDDVMKGKAVGFPDFMLPLNRNGFIEECYFDFSYSPIRKENGEVGGVLVTVIETTDKKKAEEDLKQSKDELEFAIDAAQLGTWDYNPATNRFTANSRLKEWFGLSENIEIELHHAINAIADKDRQRIVEAIEKTLDYQASGGHYEEEYSLINPITKKEIIVHGKGKAWFNENKVAYRFNGTLEDVTHEVIAQRKLEESERNLRLMIEQAPVAICVFRGSQHVVEIANEKMLELWGRPASEVMNKPIFEGLPEAKGQGLEPIVDNVFKTGERFQANERPVQLPRHGKIETTYINFVYEALKDTNGAVSGIMAIASEVTAQVTARKKTEEKEEQLRIALEGGELGTFDYYPETDTLIWSDKAKEFFGLPADAEVNYSVYLNAIHPEDRNASKSIAEQQAKSMEGGFYELEYRTISVHDGRIRWIRSKGKVNYSAEGKPIRYTGVTQDITQLKLAEEKMRQFKFMADNASDPFILTDEKGKFPYLNKKALAKWGYTEEEAKHIDGREVDNVLGNPQSYKEIFEKALQGNPPPFETIHRHKSGATYPVEINMTTLILDGKPHLFAVARDITERKKAEQALRESEEEFRQLTDSLPELVWTTDKDGNQTFASKRWKEFTGLDPYDASTFEKMVHPDDLANIIKVWTGCLASGNVYKTQVRLKSKEGDYQWFYVHGEPVKNETGEIEKWIGSFTNFNEQKRAEEELIKALLRIEESESRFKIVTNTVPVLIWMAGTDKRRNFFNIAWLNFTGHTLQQESGDGWVENIYPDDIDKCMSVYTEAFDNQKEYQMEYRLKRYDGEYRWISARGVPRFNTNGVFEGFIGACMDINEQVIYQQKLKDGEERLNIIIEASDLGTWELDLLTRAVNYSDRYIQILGREKGEILTHQQILKHLHPDDLPIREEAFKIAFDTGHLQYESRIIWPDESVHWIEGKGKVFYNDQGKPVKMIGTVQDITEEKNYQQQLKEREEKFRLLADSMPQFVWTGDAAGNLNYFNQAVYEYSGLTREQVAKEGWLQIVHPEDREANVTAWIHAIKTGTDFIFEHRFGRSDGEYRWQLSRAIPQKDASGNIQMWVGTSTDIQDIKEQDQQKDFFISMASHELKTPITSIRGYVQLLQSTYAKGEDIFLQKSLKVINKQILTLTSLIADLLDVSKIKSGSLVLNKQDFEISEMISEVTSHILHVNPDYNISFLANTATVFADRERISQVLTNLLTNAVKYSPNSKEIIIKNFVEDGHVNVYVHDSGIGINKAEQEKIFERFYRVEGKDERTYPGFGIGLFISSEIIKRHQGKIGVNSEPGKGSVFYFSIPLKK